MSESEPISLRPHAVGQSLQTTTPANTGRDTHQIITFNRHELDTILAVYGRKVAAGEWRDYALDLGHDRAVFSIFRRASEVPLFRVEKCPRLARKQGAYSVVSATGLILKRGHDLAQVLGVLEKRVRLIGQ